MALVILPIRPPLVTTTSPRLAPWIISRWSLARFCCGRKISRYMMTKMMTNGANWITMSSDPIGAEPLA